MGMTKENIVAILCNSIIQIDNVYYHCTERSFCYELYFNMKNVLLDFDENIANRYFEKNNIILNSETKKIIGNLKYPDFLIHNFESDDFQILAMEVKKEDKSLTKINLQKDLEKLTFFNKIYRFENMVFLGINISLKIFVRIINEIDNIDKFNKDIIIFLVQKNNTRPNALFEAYNLGDIIKNKYTPENKIKYKVD